MSVQTSTASLTTRLETNRKYSGADFHGWMLRHLDACPGMDVLDVGCGTGAQTLPLLDAVGPRGSVSALDISTESIVALAAAAKGRRNLEAVVSDMDAAADAISRFRVKRYDLAQSTYALYYAKEPLAVLAAMHAALKPAGRLAVCVPCAPHTLSEFIGRFIALPPAVVTGIRFGPDVVEPFFRHHFDEVDIHLLRNPMRIPETAAVMNFLRNTSYFDPSIEREAECAVAAEIAAKGTFAAEKNSYLVIGKKPEER